MWGLESGHGNPFLQSADATSSRCSEIAMALCTWFWADVWPSRWLPRLPRVSRLLSFPPPFFFPPSSLARRSCTADIANARCTELEERRPAFEAMLARIEQLPARPHVQPFLPAERVSHPQLHGVRTGQLHRWLGMVPDRFDAEVMLQTSRTSRLAFPGGVQADPCLLRSTRPTGGDLPRDQGGPGKSVASVPATNGAFD
jgi:hypothetical protein